MKKLLQIISIVGLILSDLLTISFNTSTIINIILNFTFIGIYLFMEGTSYKTFRIVKNNISNLLVLFLTYTIWNVLYLVFLHKIPIGLIDNLILLKNTVLLKEVIYDLFLLIFITNIIGLINKNKSV